LCVLTGAWPRSNGVTACKAGGWRLPRGGLVPAADAWIGVIAWRADLAASIDDGRLSGGPNAPRPNNQRFRRQRGSGERTSVTYVWAALRFCVDVSGGHPVPVHRRSPAGAAAVQCRRHHQDVSLRLRVRAVHRTASVADQTCDGRERMRDGSASQSPWAVELGWPHA
jgi:hypothetical protein